MGAHEFRHNHNGGKFLTIERLNRESRGQATYREPADSERLWTSSHARACLTHITRYIGEHVSVQDPDELSPHAWCGQFPSSAGFEWVDPADEMFGCHKCVAAADHFTGDSMGLIPNTGCEASGGARYRPGS